MMISLQAVCLAVVLIAVLSLSDARTLGIQRGRPVSSTSRGSAPRLSTRSNRASDYTEGSTKQRGSTSRDYQDLDLDARATGNRRSRRMRRPPTVKERLEAIARSSQSVASDVFRRAKVLKSSPFEGLILKATWPDDKPVSSILIKELVQHSIPAFKLARWMPDEDPYHMTAHKIWTKMAERDWRTVVKATALLHYISKDCPQDACKKFSSAIKVMSRARNIKSPDHNYFDADVISDLSDDGEPFVDLVANYAKYVLARSTLFTGHFNEVAELTAETKTKAIYSVLKAAQTSLQLGLECLNSPLPKHSLLTVHTMRLVGADVGELWNMLEEKLRQIDGIDTANDSLKPIITKVMSFLDSNREKMDHSLQEVNKISRQYRLKSISILSCENAQSSISAANLKSRIAELSGGHSNSCENGVCSRRHPAESDDRDDAINADSFDDSDEDSVENSNEGDFDAEVDDEDREEDEEEDDWSEESESNEDDDTADLDDADVDDDVREKDEEEDESSEESESNEGNDELVDNDADDSDDAEVDDDVREKDEEEDESSEESESNEGDDELVDDDADDSDEEDIEDNDQEYSDDNDL